MFVTNDNYPYSVGILKGRKSSLGEGEMFSLVSLKSYLLRMLQVANIAHQFTPGLQANLHGISGTSGEICLGEATVEAVPPRRV